MNGNFKARCMYSNTSWWTPNKIYEVVDGVIILDDGHKYSDIHGFDTLVRQCSRAIWELVEDSKLDRFAKGEIVLHTPTQEIYDKLMQWCGEKGIKWRNGQTASQINNWEDERELTTITNSYPKPFIPKGLRYENKDFFKNEGYKIETLSLADFELIPEPLSITIEFTDRETVARLVKNGKPVKQAVAKCHPDDKFSMAVGSQLALERLFEKKQKDIPTVSKVNEVKRIAKAGEWIKVVKLVDKDGYEIGDILQVDRLSDCGKLVWTIDDLNLLYHDEYVVLEGYKHVQ